MFEKIINEIQSVSAISEKIVFCRITIHVLQLNN